MATTASGFTYAVSTDTLINWPGQSAALATKLESVFAGTPNGWLTYTPVISGGWSSGSGLTISGQWSQVGKTVNVRVRMLLGAAGNSGTDLRISLPVTASQTFYMGMATLAVGGTNFLGMARTEATTTARILATPASGAYATVTQLTTAIPATWAANDTITFVLTYEAA
jgi:hypothetical protein